MLNFRDFLKEARSMSDASKNDIEYIKTDKNILEKYKDVSSLLQIRQRELIRLRNLFANNNIKLDKDFSEYSLEQLIKIAQKYVDDPYVNSKRGAKLKHQSTYQDDLDFLKSENPESTNKDIIKKRNEFIKRLSDGDKKRIDIETASLKELSDYISTNNVPLKKKRSEEWKQHEKDIVSGIQRLFDNGFFIKKSKNIKQPIQNKKFKAKQIGGSKYSDILVTNGKDDFYVEAKLNYNTASYFKFALNVVDYKIKYDHKFHISGEAKEDPEQFKFIDNLFKKIDLSTYLNTLLNNSQIKEQWKIFVDNLKQLEKYLLENDEFKQFATTFSSKYPQNFKDIANIFDKYCEFYIERYNQLISQIIELINDNKIKKQFDKFLITNKQDINGSLNELIALVSLQEEANPNIISNKKIYKTNIKLIKQIEVKFKALLKSLKKDTNNFNYLKILISDTEKQTPKLQYFFKMFLSSTGRKIRNQQLHTLINQDTEELGIMQLIPTIFIQDKTLNQKITEYYVNKDNCAYIQIDDTIFQFSKSGNPFNIPNLPLFNEAITNQEIKILVSDDLSSIHMHIFVEEPKSESLKKLSFKEKDKNYIQKVLKNIEIKTQ